MQSGVKGETAVLHPAISSHLRYEAARFLEYIRRELEDKVPKVDKLIDCIFSL